MAGQGRATAIPRQKFVAAGQWVAPWAAVLLVAATLAYAADQGLTRTSIIEPVEFAGAIPSSVRSTGPAAGTTEVGSRWVKLSYVSAGGTKHAYACQHKSRLVRA